jgi:sterol desaturase/sphingolipid hydroxylase (fatty acid hydroxylase superfamily)
VRSGEAEDPRADGRSRLERRLGRVFGDDEATAFGSGWMAGTSSLFLGGLAMLAVLAFWFPGALSTAGIRDRYPIGLLRAALQAAIVAAFALGALSLVLRRRKVLGATGVALALAATLLGGGDVQVRNGLDRRLTLGLDWFLLNLLLLALVFVPLERAFARRREQTTFRFGWVTDGVHFLVSHLGVQALAFATLLPAAALAGVWRPAALQRTVGAQPLWLQLVAILVVADLAQYWIHRAFHRVPLLWRFHAVHHSSRAIDWLAGSRLHVVDVVLTRGLVLVPVGLLGFAPGAVYGYLVLVSFHAVFIHANVGFRFGWLDHVVTTPRGHHWHHAVAPVDRNFAVHLPVLDRLFGTQHLPGDAWPEAYGIAGHPVPEGWLAQLVEPFRRR